MQNYPDPNGDSNVESYEYGDDYIIVKFKSGSCQYYKYTYGSAGEHDLEKMKQLADAGDGLNSFLTRNKPNPESKY